MGKTVSVDHIIPWGSINGLSHEEAWARLLVPKHQLQVLCESCHNTKTTAEKETRS